MARKFYDFGLKSFMSFNLGLNGRHDFFQDSLYPEENEPNNKKKLDIDRHNSNEESISGENNLFLFHENRGRNIQVCFCKCKCYVSRFT